jgi:hypothetical protein
MTRDTVKELWSMIMAVFFKGSGKEILNMGWDTKNFKIYPNIEANIVMVNHKVMEHIYGLMDKYTRVNGLMDLNIIQECGGVFEEILILDNGNLDMQMDMEFILGLMEIVMKVNLKLV